MPMFGKKTTPSTRPPLSDDPEHAEELHRNELLQSVEARDLMGYGLIPEFVGRFPVLVSLSSLQQEDLVRVLTEPRDSLVSQYTQLLKMDKVCVCVRARVCGVSMGVCACVCLWCKHARVSSHFMHFDNNYVYICTCVFLCACHLVSTM